MGSYLFNIMLVIVYASLIMLPVVIIYCFLIRPIIKPFSIDSTDDKLRRKEQNKFCTAVKCNVEHVGYLKRIIDKIISIIRFVPEITRFFIFGFIAFGLYKIKNDGFYYSTLFLIELGILYIILIIHKKTEQWGKQHMGILTILKCNTMKVIEKLLIMSAMTFAVFIPLFIGDIYMSHSDASDTFSVWAGCPVLYSGFGLLFFGVRSLKHIKFMLFIPFMILFFIAFFVLAVSFHGA